MSYKMKCSDSVDFINRIPVDLDSIKKELLNAENLDGPLRRRILRNIKKIIGSQEIEWISRNGVGRLVEYVVQRYKFKTYPRIKKLESFPLHLLIEPTSVCNLRCKMCFQSDPTFRTKEYRGMMDLKFFKNLIDQAAEYGCQSLTLASRGEPLLHKKFGEMLRYCKGKFLELKINTNATVMGEDMCYKILDAGVDIVVFSVDSHDRKQYQSIRIGANFEDVLRNIRAFCELKQSKPEYRKTATRISGVYLGLEQSRAKFAEFWKDIVDTVTLTDVVPRWDTYNNELINCSMPCSYLWERLYVWYDGTCNPCDYDYKSKLEVGNAKRSSIQEIWSGKTFQRYRNMFMQGKRMHLTPCDRCNVY